jgi:hypothetical protein
LNRRRKATRGNRIGRRIFSRFTVREKRSVEVNAHQIRRSRQLPLCIGETKTYRRQSHRIRHMYPFAIGSAEVSRPQTANTGVIAKMSAALPATITSSEMTMQIRKTRISTKHAQTTFAIEPIDEWYPKTLKSTERI